MTTKEKGRIAEEKSLLYLLHQGLTLITKNYSCRMGEIDLIMCDKNQVVFVEVRARVSGFFGGGAESITYAKRQKIIKTAHYFLLEHQKYMKHALRFDVLSMDGESASVTWIKDAFGTDY